MKTHVILILLLLIIGIVFAEDQSERKETVRIDIPLQMGAEFPFVRYRAFDSGLAYHVREVGHAHQQSGTKQLTPEELLKLTLALRALPSSHPTTNSVAFATVTVTEENKTRVLSYRCDQLPAVLKTVIESLGGLRPELKNKIKFKPIS